MPSCKRRCWGKGVGDPPHPSSPWRLFSNFPSGVQPMGWRTLALARLESLLALQMPGLCFRPVRSGSLGVGFRSRGFSSPLGDSNVKCPWEIRENFPLEQFFNLGIMDWHLGAENALFWAPVLWAVACWGVSLAPTVRCSSIPSDEKHSVRSQNHGQEEWQLYWSPACTSGLSGISFGIKY